MSYKFKNMAVGERSAETCGMLVWQVFHWFFQSIDFHTHVGALGEHVDISARVELETFYKFVNVWGGVEGVLVVDLLLSSALTRQRSSH